MQLYPAILTGSVEELGDQLAVFQDVPAVETVHIDIIDGFFVDNMTITPIDLNEAEVGDLKFDLHLMVTEPLDFVYEASTSIDKSLIRAMISQIEQMSLQSEYIEEVKKCGWKVGLALNIFTPIEEIDDSSWSEIDIIQLMSTEAGSQGQTFNPLVLTKLKEVKAKLATLDKTVEIILDGGIKEEHLEQLKELEVDGIVMGSEIWTDANPAAELRELLNEL